MSSTFTTSINLEEPALGDYANSWNTPVNSNFTIIDSAFGGATTVALSSSNVTLTVAQTAFNTIILTGALSANVELILPATVGGRRYIWNQTTGAFTVSVFNGATDAGLVCSQGLIIPIVLLGGAGGAGANYDGYQAVPPGTILHFGGVSAPPGFVLCAGESLATASFPRLFAAIGYTFGGGGANFNVPDTRGCVLAGADAMGGTPANRLTGYNVGVEGGQQTIGLSTSQLPAHNHPVNDPGHPHGTTENPHAHGTGVGGASFVTVGGPGPGSLNVGSGGNNVSTTAPATTGLTVNSNTTGISTQNTGSGSQVPIVQPTVAVSHIIRY